MLRNFYWFAFCHLPNLVVRKNGGTIRAISEREEQQARTLNYLVYGGARTTMTSLRKRCTFLSQCDERILRLLLDIPEPRKAVLEETVSDIWSRSVIEWCEDSL